MPRFVSQQKGHRVIVRNGRESYLGPQGDMVPPVTELVALFTHNLLTRDDAEEAKSRMHIRGTTEDEAGRPIDPAYRLSVFDSEVAQLQNGWTDEETDLVVAKLRSLLNRGDVIEIEPEPVVKPWNGYDAIEEPDRIVELALAVEADLAKVLAYEKANKARPEVIDALRAEIADGEEESVVVHA